VRVYDRIGADERVALRDYGGDERTMGNFRLRLVPDIILRPSAHGTHLVPGSSSGYGQRWLHINGMVSHHKSTRGVMRYLSQAEAKAHI
jgi:hypothetical protein